MQRDRIKWNDKHRHRTPLTQPSQIVKSYYRLSRKGKALDIAAGTGRNALFLAERGFSVDAVDISDVGLSHLAKNRGNVHPICADLDTFEIPANRYELIINIRFCNRRLFPLMVEGLVSGGLLIFESYLEPTEKMGEGPACRDYLLRPNELLHAFLILRVVYYREGATQSRHHPGQVASLVAIKKS